MKHFVYGFPRNKGGSTYPTLPYVPSNLYIAHTGFPRVENDHHTVSLLHCKSPSSSLIRVLESSFAIILTRSEIQLKTYPRLFLSLVIRSTTGTFLTTLIGTDIQTSIRFSRHVCNSIAQWKQSCTRSAAFFCHLLFCCQAAGALISYVSLGHRPLPLLCAFYYRAASKQAETLLNVSFYIHRCCLTNCSLCVFNTSPDKCGLSWIWQQVGGIG